MTLYEKIKVRLKDHCTSGFFGLEVCDHWFLIDLNYETNSYQLQIFYDHRASFSPQGLESLLYCGRRKATKKGYKKAVIRKIMEYVICRVNYDVRTYRSEKRLDLSFKKAMRQIVEVYDPQTGDFYGYRKA